MAQKRGRKRQQLMAATEKQLDKIVAEVKRRTNKPLSASEIGIKAGRKVNLFKVAKHFELSIGEGSFSWKHNQQSVQQEQLLDGIYVVRTSEPTQTISTPDTVRQYKSLSQIEQAFRCIKTVDLHVRPIFLRNEDHVKAHIFLCVLAYYLEWHLRQSLAELLYADEQLKQQRQTRDPVAPAEPSPSAQTKKTTHLSTGGLELQPFKTLLDDLATLGRHTCCLANDTDGPTFEQETEPSALQARVFQILEL